MAMALVGARNSSAQEMKKAMKFPENDQLLFEAYSKTLLALQVLKISYKYLLFPQN
jgi:hypothetical protein